MVIELRSWWTIRWFDLINNKDLEKKFFRGKESYEKLIRSNLDYKIKGNKILDLEYDRSFFGENFNPSIKFKKFNEKEINIIKDTILNSSFYLIKLSKNQLPEKLFEDLNKQDINLIPNSIEELEFVGNGSKGYCDENMAMFYSFGFKINKNPLLLFKIKGFNIDGIIEEYEQINTNKIKKIKDICFNKEETKEDKNKSNKIEILKTIDFNKIPNLKNIIELLVSNRTEFFKGDFRKILIKNMEYWSKYNPETKLKIFLEDNYNFKINKKSIKNSFNYIWSQTNEFKKFKININENYKITRVTGLEYTQNMENRMYYFFDEIPKEEVSKYNYNIQFSYTLFKFAKKLVEKVAIIPELLKNENNHFLIRWIPGLFNEEINEIFEKLVDICPLDLISFNEKEISKEEQTKILLSLFLKVIIKERNLLSFHELRDSKKSNIEINTNVYNLFFKGTIKKFSKEDIILVNKWISKLSSFEINRDLFVNVEEKDKAFIIDLKSEKFDSLKEALKKSDINYNFKILSEIELLEEYFEDINDLLDKDKKITYTLSEFGEFYLEIIPILNILNFKVKLPQNLEETIHPKLIANMNSRKNSQLDKKGLLNLESLVDFNWKVAISDKEITLKEFKKLVKNSSQFIKIDNKCYIVDSVETDYISQKIKRIPNKLNNNQLLQTVLSSSYENNNVEVDESILKVVEKIKNYGDIDIPHNLNGVLRPYQKRGFSWLVQNILTGFGSILADDMGLGKTLQTLTTILHFKNNGLLKNKKVLVIAPTAILFNWKNEIEKFTPSLSNEIFHGQNRVINPSIDIIITSYGMIRTNFEDFENINWFMIVLDEAQNIKNPLSKQSQMVKRLNGSSKIALTGTPVENRLIEYWSIFDFCNKSYLEGSKNFKKNFVNPIEKDRDSKILERFKKITSPFILRRMKTDKSIIHDLPDKIVTECYCSLSKIQTALYQDIINKTLREIEESEGIQRKGLVFKLINSLKQICNHPSQFTQSDKFGIEESGKMEMLIDILENIGDTGENIIIFTQFVQMGNIIKELLEDKFKNDVLFYHGGLTRKIRDKMIEEFQTNDKKISKIMIVSLKAGGTGLNLTNASHVVHFDLWWNPAVEEQATDRVYRIGQKDNVFVYRFISNGTFEERINKMLVDKKELAEITIGAGENFVTEMSTDELRDLLNLKNN